MDKLRDRPKVLFLVQLPPPIHGVSRMNQLVWECPDILKGWDRDLLQLRFSRTTSQLRRFGLLKVTRFIGILCRLVLKCAGNGYDFAYFTIVPGGPGFLRDFVFAMVIKAFRVMPVYHIHLMGIRKNSRNRILRRMYNRTFSNSVIIHLSEKVYKSEFQRLDPRDHRVFFQPNGIPGIPGTDTVLQNDGMRILHISHLYRFKGLQVLLETFARLVDEGHDITLEIIGDRADRQVYRKIMEYAALPRLKDRIIWHGLKTGNEKHEILSRADIMVLPTMNDTFPLTILEAMQHGLPVVASAKGAIPEMIEDGVSGLLIRSGDASQLHNRLEELISSPEMRLRIGTEALKVYEGRYTEKHFYTGMERIFNSLR